jgi:hypothetical protein
MIKWKLACMVMIFRFGFYVIIYRWGLEANSSNLKSNTCGYTSIETDKLGAFFHPKWRTESLPLTL